MTNEQIEFWNGKFGEEYTVRNTYSPSELDQLYETKFGVTRKIMNEECLAGSPINSILEVGSNVGNQLRYLQKMGYQNLYGIELQSSAVERSKQLTKGINIIQGSAFELPFKDEFFDLVFTSGVLIHIGPEDLKRAIHEIYRVSKKYIWGFEYFNEELIEIDYRGYSNKMWKANYHEMFLKEFPQLKLKKIKKYSYLEDDNIDVMYLLEK